MPTFSSKPFNPRRNANFLSRLAPRIRQRPVLFFGLPFVITMVGASFGLSTLTQTRYDYNATKVQTISKEEELRMKKDRRRVDLREEYFKLQAKSDELDEWEPKRITRPEGTPEWGVPANETNRGRGGKISLDPLSPADARAEREAFEDDDYPAAAAAAAATSSKKRPAVILGPDGKPCRACNSKLAFSAAFKNVAAAGNAGGSGGGGKKAATGGDKVDTSPSSSPPTTMDDDDDEQANYQACPPDGPSLGRSTWTFLHSTAAYYPHTPSGVQQSSMLSLLAALPHLYPCHSCAEALGEEYERQSRRDDRGGGEAGDIGMERAVRSGPALRKWLCGIHNEVNERLGKPRFECEEEALRQRWRDGWEDGRCD